MTPAYLLHLVEYISAVWSDLTRLLYTFDLLNHWFLIVVNISTKIFFHLDFKLHEIRKLIFHLMCFSLHVEEYFLGIFLGVMWIEVKDMTLEVSYPDPGLATWLAVWPWASSLILGPYFLILQNWLNRNAGEFKWDSPSKVQCLINCKHLVNAN